MKDRRAPNGRILLIDANATSATTQLPAFLARPEGAPVYHGFPLIEETRTEGWCFGAITAFQDADGCQSGDGFVVAPDGSRAGLVWSVGRFETEEICHPDYERWGVYSIAFPHPIQTIGDLVDCFQAVLPELKRIHEKVLANGANVRLNGRGKERPGN